MEQMKCCKGKTAYLAVNSQEQKVSTPTNEFYKNRNRIWSPVLDTAYSFSSSRNKNTIFLDVSLFFNVVAT